MKEIANIMWRKLYNTKKKRHVGFQPAKLKKCILNTVTIAIVVVTLCAFIISYIALYHTATDSGIKDGKGVFTTALLFPICIDAFLIASEGALFYVSLYEPKLIKPVTRLVIAIAAVTVWFNWVHGLPEVVPAVTATWASAHAWLMILNKSIVWLVAPIVQVSSAFVLSLLWKNFMKRDAAIAKDIIQDKVVVESPTSSHAGRHHEAKKRSFELFKLLKAGKSLPSKTAWQKRKGFNSLVTADRDINRATKWHQEFVATGTVADLEKDGYLKRAS